MFDYCHATILQLNTLQVNITLRQYSVQFWGTLPQYFSFLPLSTYPTSALRQLMIKKQGKYFEVNRCNISIIQKSSWFKLTMWPITWFNISADNSMQKESLCNVAYSSISDRGYTRTRIGPRLAKINSEHQLGICSFQNVDLKKSKPSIQSPRILKQMLPTPVCLLNMVNIVCKIWLFLPSS